MSQTQTLRPPASTPTPSSSPVPQHPIARPVSSQHSAKQSSPSSSPIPSPTATAANTINAHLHTPSPAPPSHMSSPTPPPSSATPPPPTNTCPHYTSISVPTLHSRFRIPSFLGSFPSAASLPCADCRRVFPKKDMWVCLTCERGLDVRCGRGADSACAISHANTTRHGLVLNCVTRMIWCYFCDCEVIDEYDTHSHQQQQQQPTATTPQRIRHCLDVQDPSQEPDEEKHSKPRRSTTQQLADGTGNGVAGEEDDDEDEDEENMTWLDYYMNGKGGEVGMSNLGNTSDHTYTHIAQYRLSPAMMSPLCAAAHHPMLASPSLCWYSCFMNSALQALTHTPPLIAFVSHMSHIPLDSIRQRLIADFSILLQKVWSGHYSLVAPGDLLRDVVFINPFFRGYGQHDAQELIRCVLDQMHEGLKRCEEYEYTRYVYGEGTGEEQEVRWRERELQKEREKLIEKVKERRGKKGEKTERKRRERDHSTTNGHRHTASVSSNSSTPSTTAPATPTAAAAAEYSTTTSASSASTTSVASAASSHSSLSAAHSTSAPSASASSSSASAPSPSPDSSKKPVKIWPDHSIISDIFSGYLQSRIRCHQCNTISTVYDQFYDLSLEIPKESNMKRIAAERGTEALTPPTKQSWLGSLLTYTGLVPPPLSLETCLHAFSTSDRLIDRDQYRCDQCKTKVDASKTLALHSLPEVLMLHVKRFSHNSYFGSKVNRHVNFPINGLDMRPFLSEDKRARMAKAAEAAAAGTASAATADDSSLYDLYAVIRHLGSVAGGHYIAYAKNHVTGKWYEFDDRIVTEISEKKLAEVEAYVLFYRHRHSDSQRKQLLDRIQDATLTSQQPAPTRFISRQYVKKVSVLGRVEPIDNRDLLCVHGVPYELPADGGQLAIPVSKAGWDRLVKQYGGGPLVDGGRYECEQCLIPIIRARERKRISALDNEATHNSLPTDPFYLIHDDWLRQWRAFIQEKGQRPGPITNQSLLDAEGRPRPALVKVRDYRGLHGTVWDELLRCYGGGPVIVRKRLDIYEEEDVAQSGVQQVERKEEKEQQQESKQARADSEQNGGDEEMAAAEAGDEEEDEEGEDETQMVVSFHTSSEQPTSPLREQRTLANHVTTVDVAMADKMEEENKTASPTSHQQQSPAAISLSGNTGA